MPKEDTAVNKTDEKKRAEFYLRVSKILREASIKIVKMPCMPS